MTFLKEFMLSNNLFTDPVLVFFKRRALLTSKFGFILTCLFYIFAIYMMAMGLNRRLNKEDYML